MKVCCICIQNTSSTPHHLSSKTIFWHGEFDPALRDTLANSLVEEGKSRGTGLVFALMDVDGTGSNAFNPPLLGELTEQTNTA